MMRFKYVTLVLFIWVVKVRVLHASLDSKMLLRFHVWFCVKPLTRAFERLCVRRGFGTLTQSPSFSACVGIGRRA